MDSKLFPAVEDVIRSGRIGRPVFVRWLLLGQCETPLKRLTQAATIARGWLGGPTIDRLYALGSPDDSALVLSMGFQDGTAAMLATGPEPAPEARIDILILGNRGSVCFDSSGVDGALTFDDVLLDQGLQAVIEFSLRHREPMSGPGALRS